MILKTGIETLGKGKEFIKKWKDFCKTDSILKVQQNLKKGETCGLMYSPKNPERIGFDVLDINPKMMGKMTKLTKSQIENSNWLDAYLNEVPVLKKILGVSQNAKVDWAETLEKPFISTNSGGAVIFDRELGLWKEYSKETFDEIQKAGKIPFRLRPVSTVKTNGDITIKRIVINNRDEKYIIYNGNKTMIRENLTETIEEIGKEPKVEDFSQGFGRKVAYCTRNQQLEELMYKTPNLQNATMTTGYQHNGTQVLNDIEEYVKTFDCGTFKKCSKDITLNVNGTEERIHLVYEGIDYDIDVNGRLLQKIKVQDKVKECYVQRQKDTACTTSHIMRAKEKEMMFA